MKAAKIGANNDPDNARIPSLDGLRGIAIILVMLHHFSFYGWETDPTTKLDLIVKQISLGGWIGVDLFFVLSGFLITGILVSTKEDRRYFKNFYMRRFFRIFPLYFGFLLAFIFFLPVIDQAGAQIQNQISEQAWYWTYLINWRIGFQGWPKYYGIAHFWSLAVEEQFYLIWPAIVYLFSRKNMMLICIILILVSPVIRVIMIMIGNDLAGYTVTFSRMDALALGGLLALLIREGYYSNLVHLTKWPVVILTGPIVLVYTLWRGSLEADDYFVLALGFSMIALFFAGLLIFARFTPADKGIGRIFSSKPLRFFGKYSYGLYVFHHLVSIYLPMYGFSVESIPAIKGSHLPGYFGFCLVATILSIGLAVASWHLWELPFLKLKRHYEYDRIGLQPADASYPIKTQA